MLNQHLMLLMSSIVISSTFSSHFVSVWAFSVFWAAALWLWWIDCKQNYVEFWLRSRTEVITCDDFFLPASIWRDFRARKFSNFSNSPFCLSVCFGYGRENICQTNWFTWIIYDVSRSLFFCLVHTKLRRRWFSQWKIKIIFYHIRK